MRRFVTLTTLAAALTLAAAPGAGAAQDCDMEVAFGCYPIVSEVDSTTFGGSIDDALGLRISRARRAADEADQYDEHGVASDCGLSGVAKLTVVGAAIGRWSITSQPGCIFEKRTYELKGGVRIAYRWDSGLDGYTFQIGLVGKSHRTVRTTLNWELAMQTIGGYGYVFDANYRALDSWRAYGGGSSSNRGTASFVRKYYRGKRTRWLKVGGGPEGWLFPKACIWGGRWRPLNEMKNFGGYDWRCNTEGYPQSWSTTLKRTNQRYDHTPPVLG